MLISEFYGRIDGENVIAWWSSLDTCVILIDFDVLNWWTKQSFSHIINDARLLQNLTKYVIVDTKASFSYVKLVFLRQIIANEIFDKLKYLVSESTLWTQIAQQMKEIQNVEGVIVVHIEYLECNFVMVLTVLLVE